MDTALLLRKKYDEKRSVSDAEIERLLEQSNIIKKLTSDYEEKELFNIFRIICLSEIPYVNRLEYTRKLVTYISRNIVTSEGFSYTGKVNYIVPCYNAMLLEAYTRLEMADTKEVQEALQWVKKYQVFERNKKTKWKHNGICKHGGCMNAVPCYIGIGKTVRALITYAEYTNHIDKEVENLIDKGIQYMLKHKMFQRLSNGKPISKHITEIMFPQAYMLSLTDLVYIVEHKALWNEENIQPLKDIIIAKAVDVNQWKIDYIYSYKGYKVFETKRKPSDWIAYIFPDTKKL